jgi:hypothetical protein
MDPDPKHCLKIYVRKHVKWLFKIICLPEVFVLYIKRDRHTVVQIE